MRDLSFRISRYGVPLDFTRGHDPELVEGFPRY